MSKKSPVKRYEVHGKVLWSVSFDKQGHRVRKKGFANKGAAQAYFELAEKLIVTGQYKDWLFQQGQKDYTLREVYKMWIKSPMKSQRKSTIDTYVYDWEKNLDPYFGSMTCDEVNNRAFHKYMDRRRSEGVGDASLKRSYNVVKVLLSWAFDRGIIENIPTFRVSLKIKARKIVITPEDIFMFAEDHRLKHIPENRWFRNFLIVQFFTMTRAGEVLGLRKEDINFEAKTLRICRTWSKGVIGPTKNNKIHEAFPINEDLLEILREQYMLGGSSEWLFPALGTYYKGDKRLARAKRKLNQPACYRNVDYWFSYLKKKYDIPGLSSHQIRKCSISYFVNAGAALKSVEFAARISGQTILNHYSQVEKKRFEKTYENLFEMGHFRSQTDNQKENKEVKEGEMDLSKPNVLRLKKNHENSSL